MSKLKLNKEKAFQIIREHGLDVNLCNDAFFIVQSWEALNKLVARFNSVPVDYIDYGRVDIDRVLDADKEFYDIDDILGDWGFDDEWACCDMCGNSVRTSPDSWSWMADYWIHDGTLICGKCIRDDESLIEDYVNHLINNSKSANTILKEEIFEKLGFKKCVCDVDGNECAFENGWYQGQNDDPKTILKKAIEKNKSKEYIFDITEVGQFDIHFTMWSREKNDINV